MHASVVVGFVRLCGWFVGCGSDATRGSCHGISGFLQDGVALAENLLTTWPETGV